MGQGWVMLVQLLVVPLYIKLLGIEAHGDTAVALIRDMLPQLKEADLLTLAVGACGVAAMICSYSSVNTIAPFALNNR